MILVVERFEIILEASVQFLLLSNPVPCRGNARGSGGPAEYLIVWPLIYERGIYGLAREASR